MYQCIKLSLCIFPFFFSLLSFLELAKGTLVDCGHGVAINKLNFVRDFGHPHTTVVRYHFRFCGFHTEQWIAVVL